MFLEMIFKIVVVFDPEFLIRVHNKLHQPLPRIAYMDLGIVPLAAPAFFFLLTHCLPELITTFVMCSGVIFRDCLFFISVAVDVAVGLIVASSWFGNVCEQCRYDGDCSTKDVCG